MSRFKTGIEKGFSIELPTLLKLEYKTNSGKFDKEKYSKALENFYNTIDEIEIPPFEDFLMIGVENLHELDAKYRKMLKELAKKVGELEARAFPRMFEKMIEGFKELERKHPELFKKSDT